jgi:hypothetical protein
MSAYFFKFFVITRIHPACVETKIEKKLRFIQGVIRIKWAGRNNFNMDKLQRFCKTKQFRYSYSLSEVSPTPYGLSHDRGMGFGRRARYRAAKVS